MTTEEIVRSLPVDAIELEGAEGRTLHARLLRWDEPSMVSDGGPPYQELWRAGVFSQSIKRAISLARGWPLMYNHDRQSMPLGMVSAVHERSDGPWMTSKISKTTAGDDVIELVRDGAIPGVSVAGTSIRSKRNDAGIVERIEVALREISMTPFPSLVGADSMVLRAAVIDGVPGSVADLQAFLDSITA